MLLSYYTGELCFKDFKRNEMTKKYGHTRCFAGCDKPDNLEHVMECEEYDTKPENFYQDGTDRRFVKYLAALDVERWRKFECPLIYRPDRVQNRKRTQTK